MKSWAHGESTCSGPGADGDRDKLERLTRSSTVSAGAAQRARIVLLAVDGVPNDQISELVGCGRQKVLQWRGRYQDKGMAGLLDRQRPGRPGTIDHRKIMAETLNSVGVLQVGGDLLVEHRARDARR